MQPHRPQWKTRIGFLCAALGSAVGLGNIWRFSYLCYKNGGGAFLIPYFIALLCVGIPIIILEIGIGHKMRGSAPMSFAKIDRRWEWLGWWSVIFVMFGIVLYYSVIISWCFNYLLYSFNLGWGEDTNSFFFQKFLAVTSGPFDIGDIRSGILIALGLVWFLNWLIVFLGIEKGIERANKIFMPLLFILIGILVLWSLRLPGSAEGVKIYLRPDFSILSKPRVWIDAFSQIFFTLSLGFGIMIAYGSYLPRKSDIVLNSYTISVLNCLFSFFAGFAVFSIIGYMSYQTNMNFNEVIQESIGLAFVVYPKAIGMLPFLPRVFGVLFFSTLCVAGISSSISIIEAFNSALIDKFHYQRKNVTSAICILGFLGSIIFTSGGGLFWIDIVDHFLSHYGLILVGILQAVLIGWIYKAEKLRLHIDHVSDLRIGRWWNIAVKYLVPGVLLILLFNDIVYEIFNTYGGYSQAAVLLIGRDWLIYTLFAALLFAMRPWRKDIHSDTQ
ncbi:MAG TPA: sodium-dependent transporter [Candidatus Omnitrophica bacterium]|nr:sodium-dependent transporter [Candidatus Omnitrophota bacterium]